MKKSNSSLRANQNCTSGKTVSELGNLTNTWGKYGVLTACVSSVSGQWQRELSDRKMYKQKKGFPIQTNKTWQLQKFNKVAMTYKWIMSRWHKRTVKHAKYVYLTHFPFGLGCSGVAIGRLVNGVLLMEKTCDVYFQILGSDLQTLHVSMCNTHGKHACAGLLYILMPLFAADRSLVAFNTKIIKDRSYQDLGI